MKRIEPIVSLWKNKKKSLKSYIPTCDKWEKNAGIVLMRNLSLEIF